jgi:hypothetical protein
MWRALLIGLAAIILGGCGLVYSPQPLFGPADAPGVPALRSGIWVLEDPDSHCRPRPQASVRHWKGCETWMLVRDTDIATVETDRAWSSTGYLIASGEPLIWQIGPEADEAGLRYVYFGLRALTSDAEGRVTRFEAWNGLCGPPQKVAKPQDKRRAAHEPQKLDTAALLPGLVPTESGSDCWASHQAAVRRAVAYGAEHPEWRMNLGLHWVREARADDFASH